MRPFFDQNELIEVKAVLDSGWVAQGPKVKEFEEKVAKYIGLPYAVAVSNCTAALHLSLLSLGIKKNDEVLVADYTFPATGHSVLYCGGKPRFVDIDMKTYNIDPDKIEKKITRKTKAIIPVHTFGQPADMAPIMEIAQEYGLKVIEDAACAFGAKYNNKFAGTIGDIGCFSFHARKGITTGEGGMVVTADKEIAEKVRRLSVFGMQSAWTREQSAFTIPIFTDLGYNYKMSDITAAFGVAQLPKLEEIIKRKQQLAKYWDEKLIEIGSIQPPYASKNVSHIYQTYVSLVDKHINRNKLIEILRSKGIQAHIGTYSSCIQPVYISRDICPNSLEVFNRALALPLYYTLTEENIDIAASCLKETLGELQ
jgi:dTDP-4-amino-4,6-dideoxygalactose transaminase